MLFTFWPFKICAVFWLSIIDLENRFLADTIYMWSKISQRTLIENWKLQKSNFDQHFWFKDSLISIIRKHILLYRLEIWFFLFQLFNYIYFQIYHIVNSHFLLQWLFLYLFYLVVSHCFFWLGLNCVFKYLYTIISFIVLLHSYNKDTTTRCYSTTWRNSSVYMFGGGDIWICQQ